MAKSSQAISERDLRASHSAYLTGIPRLKRGEQVSLSLKNLKLMSGKKRSAERNSGRKQCSPSRKQPRQYKPIDSKKNTLFGQSVREVLNAHTMATEVSLPTQGDL